MVTVRPQHPHPSYETYRDFTVWWHPMENITSIALLWTWKFIMATGRKKWSVNLPPRQRNWEGFAWQSDSSYMKTLTESTFTSVEVKYRILWIKSLSKNISIQWQHHSMRIIQSLLGTSNPHAFLHNTEVIDKLHECIASLKRSFDLCDIKF